MGSAQRLRSDGTAGNNSAAPSKDSTSDAFDKHSRYLPVAVRRATYDRDGGSCAFVCAEGRRCGAQTFVAFGRVKPFAKQGVAEDRDLRLPCKAP